MESVTRYILTVCSAAIACGVVKSLTLKKGPASELIHMICGVFLAVTAVRPLIDIQITDLAAVTDSCQWDAEQIAEEARQDAQSSMNEIIITRARAYIMDKAATLNAAIDVQILLSEDTPAIPCGAIISGTVSPYAKTRLSEILESELGIVREAQQWKI